MAWLPSSAVEPALALNRVESLLVALRAENALASLSLDSALWKSARLDLSEPSAEIDAVACASRRLSRFSVGVRSAVTMPEMRFSRSSPEPTPTDVIPPAISFALPGHAPEVTNFRQFYGRGHRLR